MRQIWLVLKGKLAPQCRPAALHWPQTPEWLHGKCRALWNRKRKRISSFFFVYHNARHCRVIRITIQGPVAPTETLGIGILRCLGRWDRWAGLYIAGYSWFSNCNNQQTNPAFNQVFNQVFSFHCDTFCLWHKFLNPSRMSDATVDLLLNRPESVFSSKVLRRLSTTGLPHFKARNVGPERVC